MLQNYLKIAWRSLWQRRFFTLLNIVGLAVGITFASLIGAYVWGEYGVNRQLRRAPQQCLLQSRWTKPDLGMPITTLAPLATALQTQYPTLVASTYRYHGVNATVSRGPNHFRESIQVGDSTLLTQFGLPLLHGDPKTALNSPNAVVLTADKATKYFGRTDVLNQSLTIETPQGGKQTFQVTGVLAPLSQNSATNLLGEPSEIFLPPAALRLFGADLANWQNPYIVGYVELQPGVSPAQLTKPLAQLVRTNAPGYAKDLTAYLTPLTDYYLQSNDGLVRRMIGVLAAVAGFLLLMAAVNFVNLSVGSASVRLREIGVRKALGGQRRQVAAQFLAEAFVLTSLAGGLSVAGYVAGRSLFGEAVGRTLPSLTELPAGYVLALVGLVLLLAGLAGAYPALHLSGWAVVDSLKGKSRSVREGQWLRRGLVTVQFAIATVVCVGAVVVSRQIGFLFSSDLGFEKESLLTVSSLPRNWSPEGVARMAGVRAQLARVPGVEAVSLSYEIPNGNVGNTVSAYQQGRDSTQAVATKFMTTDEQYAQTYKLQLRAGRYFHADQRTYDPMSVVLNEAATRALGFASADAALGQPVRFQNDTTMYRVRGVINDFHVGTLHERVGPLAIGQVRAASIYRFFTFRLAPGNPRRTLDALKQRWRTLFPDAPFDYAFMDQTLQKLYQSEVRLERAAYLATGLSLLIVLLGVIGLVSLSVSRRAKEVGIRKVLGANVPDVLRLFLREYVGLIVVANLVAWPLAYWLLSGWLANYAYRAPLTVLPFIGVGIGLLTITALLVSSQVLRTALTNPVKALRSE